MKDEDLETLDDLADEIIGLTETSMRKAISKIPDGIYPYEGIIEGSGRRGDIQIKLSVSVKESDIEVDFEGTSPQVGWGVNVTYAYVFMAVKSAFDPDIPINEGAVRPVKIKAPEGSVVNCSFPAAVAARMQVGHFMTEMVFRAIAEAAPDRIIADSGGTPAQTNIFYGKGRKSKPWHTMIIRGGGLGAGLETDGRHCAIFPANGANTPVEIFESDTPLVVEARELICNSGGPGKMRGGLGRRMAIRIPNDEYAPSSVTTVAVQAGRFRHPPAGIFGGGSGARAKFLHNGRPADPTGLTLCDPGDTLEFHSAGGGGYGNPFERDAKAVRKDFEHGYVSAAEARKVYGVHIDSETGEADPEKTSELRKT